MDFCVPDVFFIKFLSLHGHLNRVTADSKFRFTKVSLKTCKLLFKTRVYYSARQLKDKEAIGLAHTGEEFPKNMLAHDTAWLMALRRKKQYGWCIQVKSFPYTIFVFLI